MRRTTLHNAIALGLAAGPTSGTLAQDEIEYYFRNFAQITAEHRDEFDDSIKFGADRIRFRGHATRGPLTGGIMLDFGVDDLGDREPGALANVIGDLFLNYRPNASHLVRFGQFKTPIGYDFNISGGDLDITKRGLDAGLILGRDLGVMLSGRRVWRGIGYDVGLFNPAGRSAATDHRVAQIGDDSAPVVRLHYDTSEWHVEAAHGRSERAGGPGTLDYRVSDVAVVFRRNEWTAKAEWIEGENIRGVGGWDERVYYLHGAYRLRPRLEVLTRHYQGRNTLAGASTELSNTYLGMTFNAWSSGIVKGRLQVNYVLAGGDGVAYTGLRGFRDDAFLLQFQFEVER